MRLEVYFWRKTLPEHLDFRVAKPNYIELGERKALIRIPILYEDRSVLAIDKPPGWMLAPTDWMQTSRNLPAALESSIAAGDFWAHSRNLKFLRHVHRLDAETSGVLLFTKSPGAVRAYSELFENRVTEKIYLAIVRGVPKQTAWVCNLKLAPVERQPGKMFPSRTGKDSETHFNILQTRAADSGESVTLVEARPLTGRTHQIRVHLAESGCPVVNDFLYGVETRAKPKASEKVSMGLRAIELAYMDPFSRRRIKICAPSEEFLRGFGFNVAAEK